MKIKIPKFDTREEMFDYLAKNVKDHLQQKKASLKEADCMVPSCILMIDKDFSNKSSDSTDSDTIKVRAIINTTNVMDSHEDVHLPKIWNKSIKDNKFIKHIQEHKMQFDKIISDKDELKVYTKTYAWRDLGIDADGKTQALVFDSDVKKSRNKFMFNEYKSKNVDNHSVGMFYVNLKFAMDSNKEEHEKYKVEFYKHIDSILNKEEVKKKGYFYSVYEAKVREGSAVPLGSNYITPTLSRRKDTNEEKEIAAEKALSPYINFLNQIK